MVCTIQFTFQWLSGGGGDHSFRIFGSNLLYQPLSDGIFLNSRISGRYKQCSGNCPYRTVFLLNHRFGLLLRKSKPSEFHAEMLNRFVNNVDQNFPFSRNFPVKPWHMTNLLFGGSNQNQQGKLCNRYIIRRMWDESANVDSVLVWQPEVGVRYYQHADVSGTRKSVFASKTPNNVPVIQKPTLEKIFWLWKILF
jgi:hypothetical protein